ncbi:MAG: hypothetical protein ABH879_08695, partial [archaeon]
NLWDSYDYYNDSVSTKWYEEGIFNVRKRFYIVSSFNDQGETSSSTVIAKYKQNMTFKPGSTTKNWITIPVTMNQYSNAQDILDALAPLTAITFWNASSQQAVACNRFSCPSGESCQDTLCNFAIIPGTSYEVEVNSTGPQVVNWTLFGPVAARQNLSLQRSGSTGANWISMHPNSSIKSVSHLMGSIGADKASVINRWDPVNQRAEGWINVWGGMGTNFSMADYEGYEVWVSQSVTWSQQ